MRRYAGASPAPSRRESASAGSGRGSSSGCGLFIWRRPVLSLARVTQGEREVALRFSLGAWRAVVAGQLLTETAVLAFAGVVGGLLVAAGASAAIRRWAPELPRLHEIGIDARILMYTMASAIVVALLCGIFP